MVMTVNKTKLWCVVIVAVTVALEVESLNGPNVCMVQQKYNITKRVKYRAPMSVRTYEWCFSMPPRCSKWKTEMRELTKLETDERIAEVAVCCPGYKMKDISCVPICPSGKTGHRCSDDCPPNRWGPNCANECDPCHGSCSPITGDCSCQDGWQGESCEIRMPPTTSTTTTAEDLLTIPATKPTPPITPTISTTRPALIVTTSTPLAITTPSRTTLVEITNHLDRLEPISETPTPVSNKTVAVETLLLLNKTLLLDSTSLVTKTTLLEITSTPSTTTEPTTVIKTTKSPLMTPDTRASPSLNVTPENTISTVAPVLIVTTTVATTVPATTTELTISIPITESKPTEKMEKTSPKTITTTVQAIKAIEEMDKTVQTTTTELTKLTTTQRAVTVITNETIKTGMPVEQTTRKIILDSKYNRTEVPIVPTINIKELHIPVHIAEDTPVKVVTPYISAQPKIITFNNITDVPISTTQSTHHAATVVKMETTKRPESTIRYFPTTVKFKPKEIWIRPAQKGEPYKSKSEAIQDSHLKTRVTQPNTTPKTIVVSIIPTSVSYVTFKKIALTTTSLLSTKTNMTVATNGTAEQEVTKPMLTSTESPSLYNVTHKIFIASKLNKTEQLHPFKSEPRLDRTTKTLSTFHTTREFSKNETVSKNETNSMMTIDKNLNSSTFLTTPSTNVTRTTQLQNKTLETATIKPVVKFEKVTRPIKIITVKPRNVTIITVSGKNKNETVVKITKAIATDIEKTNSTRTINFIKTNQVTTESADDEEFHILTEPEHITAVMEGKGKERTSLDLVSVISIAGGIMMAVITVAVIIVMVERCKKPRYNNVRKISDIRMQVMIDDDDIPPPYVRSIFHTPLPEPPNSEKCHYQPISTLDRNLKQFMRPVVVQSISPIMLENFRGILECHYDHLPRRSHHFEQSQRHCSLAPSMSDVDELTLLRPCSAMDSTIEALKCEARLDVIDSTTSEPLYAEIPCWRPPSEHAIEIMNLNGEAVTEL